MVANSRFEAVDRWEYARYDLVGRQLVARVVIGSVRVVLGVNRRNRNVRAGIRVALAVLPLVVGLSCAAVASAAPGPVQPGVVMPNQPAEPEAEPQADLRAAAPQNSAPAPRSAPKPAPPKPDKPAEPEAPAPRTVRLGEFSAPVPEGVPNEVVDGVNRTTEGIQNALVPGPAPQQP